MHKNQFVGVWQNRMRNKLTAKQEKFCLAYMETGNASEAYRQAYNAGKMKAETIKREAQVLLNNHTITTRLEALKKPILEKAQITFESHLEELAQLRDLAKEAKQYAPAIAAETSRGRASGYYVEKSQVTVDNIKPFVIVRYAGD